MEPDPKSVFKPKIGAGSPALSWSKNFLLLDARRSVAELLDKLDLEDKRYVVLAGLGRLQFYVFTRDEIRALLLDARRKHRLKDALSLRSADASPPIRVKVETPDVAPGAAGPGSRFVRIGPSGMPVAIGDWSDETRIRLGRKKDLKIEDLGPGGRITRIRIGDLGKTGGRSAGSGIGRDDAGHTTRGGRSGSRPAAERAGPPPPPDDVEPARPPEGADITRYPSITWSGTREAGAPLTITVDLLLEDLDPETKSRPVALTLSRDWTKVPVQVHLMSDRLSFAKGGDSGTITVRRDKASIPCTLACTVNDDVRPGDEVEVIATFSYQDRFCGFARRLLKRPRRTSRPQTNGTISIELGVEPPDLTVTIFHPQRSPAGCFAWHVKPRVLFDGLPERLREEIDLGEHPGEYARSLFARCADLVPGKHMNALEGIGQMLWRRAPECFRSVYWAMRQQCGQSFSIQFISDDPYIPWELMQPYKDGEEPVFLAAAHPVARWIADYESGLRNRLPAGRIVTIAPNYGPGASPLPGAQIESGDLELALGAKRVPGTTADVLRMLHQGLGSENVAVMHFAGHGEFGIDFADQSRILLEDGSLSVTEAGNQRVKLGEKCRTLVIFNACEIGAIGSVLGMVGGWAEAFSRRKFSGFVAPLWAVRDQDAAEVISELLHAVWRDHETMGAALMKIRATRGTRSPTFFSYLFYGDVMARVPETGQRPA